MHLSAALVCALCAASSASAGTIQKAGLKQSTESKSRAAAVKSAFKGAFDDYLRYGYPDDEVLPLSKGRQNTRNGWGASLFDALDTLYVMGFKDEFDDAVAKAVKVDFSKSYVASETVSVFETTIRYLGGMLSAYELSGAKNKRLLARAQQLGDKLVHAWPTSSQQVPYGFLNFTTDQPIVANSNVAEAGTLSLEFDRLSEYTGKTKYRDLATKSVKAIFASGNVVFPGLPGQGINPATAQPTSDYVTWGGGTDSAIEYLVKYAILTSNRDPFYLSSWQSAVHSSVKYLKTQSSVKNLTYLADYTQSGGGKRFVFSHLACFVGGNWLLGGKVLGDQEIFGYGLELVDTCMNSYAGTATGIGPEGFAFVGPHNSTAGSSPSPSDLAFYKRHGFFITNGNYILRPEVIESAFMAYRTTGDTKYQDFVWKVFNRLNKYCKAPASYAALYDVNDASGPQIDDCESFFYAEVWKYLYLTFAPPSNIDLDHYVFNTECHPFKVQPLSKPLSPSGGSKKKVHKGKKRAKHLK